MIQTDAKAYVRCIIFPKLNDNFLVLFEDGRFVYGFPARKKNAVSNGQCV